MRRLTAAFLILFSTAVLVACGDTGDHLGEFRQQPPPPTTVQTLTAIMPIIPGLASKGTFSLQVTGYNGGQAIAIGTQLKSAISVTTNYPGYVHFGTANGPSHAIFNAQPSTIKVYYTKPPVPLCRSSSIPSVFVVAFDRDANPQTADVNMNGCGGGQPSPSPSPSGGPSTSPSPSTKPSGSPSPSPTPSSAPIVKRIALSMPATPNPLSPGTFTLVVTVYGPTGQVIAPGTTLVDPLQFTSNSSCSISYAYNATTGNSITIPTAPGSIVVTYSPPSANCTPPSQINLIAFDVDANPQTAEFSILGGTATVASMTLSMLADPNTATTGIYPFFVTARDTTGAVIPFGMTLSNPIQLSSNASCATGFGVTSTPGTFTGTFQINSTQTQVFTQFIPPGNTGNTCGINPPVGGNVVITGVAAGGISQTFSFPY